jgi:hypothetical protein
MSSSDRTKGPNLPARSFGIWADCMPEPACSGNLPDQADKEDGTRRCLAVGVCRPIRPPRPYRPRCLSCHPTFCRKALDHSFDHPDDRSVAIGNRLERRGIQPEQARSVWSHPGRRRASDSQSEGRGVRIRPRAPTPGQTKHPAFPWLALLALLVIPHVNKPWTDGKVPHPPPAHLAAASGWRS